MSLETVDCQNQPVRPGDRVRILAITPDPDMDEDDLEMFNDMVGAVCDVDRIDDDGAAWVAVWWNCDEGSLATTVGLWPAQMRKVVE